MKVAVLGAGCFWCVEAVFSSLKGVLAVEPGYAGGDSVETTYEEVCAGHTGHAEVVRIEYDPDLLSFEFLLEVFFHTHDPTTLNRQGNDVGTQYRSVIFYQDSQEFELAHKVLQSMRERTLWDSPIVTSIESLKNYSRAELYHLNYFNRNPQQPYCQAVVAPKIQKFREKYFSALK